MLSIHTFRMSSNERARGLRALVLCMGLSACGAEPVPFSMNFEAISGADAASCTASMSGYGPDGQHAVGLSDLRFYVSDLKFYDSEGAELEVTLDSNEFQYADELGDVALLDFTANAEGSCATNAIAFAEGTARTNAKITGTALDTVRKVGFRVGLPQPLMKRVISTNTAEDAPSPMNEMYWSWASGYRHFVMNFTVRDGQGGAGEGYVHIGSRDCGGDGAKALTDRDRCGLVNTPAVMLDGFDPAQNTVTVDIQKLLAGLDFVAPIRDSEPPFDVIGMGPGVSCHSSPMQSHCASLFQNFGLNQDSGAADESRNQVFSFR